MVVDVIVPERLLDHEQVELVEPAQMVEFIQAISRVRVAAQQNLRPALANLFKNVEIPSLSDLNFDALVSGADFRSDLFQQLIDAVLNSDGNTGWNLLAPPSEQSRERDRLLLGLRFPESVFQSCLGHTVPANPGKQRGAVPGRGNSLAEKQRDQILAKHGPRGVGALFGVVRTLVGNALTPSLDAFAVNGDQGDAALVDPPEAGLKKMDQRHVQFTQGNSFDIHGLPR